MNLEGSVTQTLANFATRITFDDLPKKVIHQTKRIICDTIGCALGGYLTERGQIIRTFVSQLGGNPESTIIGSGEKTSCTNAALANSNMANSLDNDSLLFNNWHPSLSAVCAALSIGEREKANGKDLITAIATGFDIAVRIGMSPEHLYPGWTIEDGQLLVPPLGRSWKVFGVACAAGKILKLDDGQMINALGLAAMVTPFNTFGKFSTPPESLPLVKYFDNSWVTLGGLTSAMLAKLGYTGPRRVLDGENGFWGMAGSEKRDIGFMVSNLGQKWWIMEITFKPWPCCSHVQYSMTALKRILEKHNLKGEEVDKVIVKGDRLGSMFHVVDPEGPVSMQFNVPYNLANIAFNVVPGPQWQDPAHVDNPRMKEFRRKVKIEVDPKTLKVLAEQLAGELPRAPKRIPTTVKVIAGGKVFSETVEYAKGDPWSPETEMTDGDLQEKFRINAADVLSRKRIEDSIETLNNLEEIGDLGELTKLLSPEPSRCI